MQEMGSLQERIEEKIALDARVNNRIDVEVSARHVRLSGVVNTLREKTAAEEDARSFGPVQLESDIAIEAQDVDEGEILEHSQQALADHAELVEKIGVDRIVDGVAYLRGRSESVGAIAHAADIVAGVPGIRDVISEVQIRTDVPIDDIDLRNEVLQALHAEMPKEAEFIGVRVQDRVVYLDGPVGTMQQKRQAGEIAKRMPGSAKVINNLATRGESTSIDEAIEREVLKALELAKINMVDARVSVLDGLVYLDGTVSSIEQREKAYAIAEAVPGVSGVQNDLVVGFHIEPKAG
jgi:osmotically-inducible protein OsmY